MSKHKWRKELAGKKASALVVMDFVANNLGRNPDEIPIEEIPCNAAMALLREADKNGNHEWFFDGFYAKTIPSKQQLEVAERQKDDGRALTLLDQLSKEFEDEPAGDNSDGSGPETAEDQGDGAAGR